MVMKINCEVEQNLCVTISYDDGTMKTKLVGVGDYVSVAYNYNGARRVINGTVSSIHANPASLKTTKNDWYMVIANDDPDTRFGSVKILILNLIDIEVLRMHRQGVHINTPNNSMRVTDIRLKAGYLQVSNNNGRSWKTVGLEPVSDLDIPEAQELHDKLHAMIGSDQYETSDDLIRGIEMLIKEEARKIAGNVSIYEENDDACHCDQPWDCNCGANVNSNMSSFV